MAKLVMDIEENDVGKGREIASRVKVTLGETGRVGYYVVEGKKENVRRWVKEWLKVDSLDLQNNVMKRIEN